MKGSKNFAYSEFACKCQDDCKEKSGRNIDPNLVTKLQSLRDNFGPLVLTSASRCDAHNIKVGGAPKSQHRRQDDGYTKAVDVAISFNKYDFIREAMKLGLSVGIAKTFIHLDTRPNPAVFTY